MSQANIDNVQSWLSLELEQLGIDAVVYSRYILNLFMNSHFTTDLHLAKKEANIFARLPPGPTKNKPKQKYRKRSNSSPFLDEVALKKGKAADCLQSALDDAATDNRKKVEELIDDLYIKLNSLNLLTDTSSNSNERRVGKPKEKRRESYHDAFPLLLDTPDNADNIDKPNYSVWNGQNVLKPQVQLNEDSDKNAISGKTKVINHKSNYGCKVGTEDGHQQQTKLKGKSKKINSQRKSSKRRLHPFELAKKSPAHGRHKNFHQRTKERFDFNKENANESKPYPGHSLLDRKGFNQYSLQKKTKFENKKSQQQSNTIPVKSKSFFDNTGTTVTPGRYFSNSYNTMMTGTPQMATKSNSSIEKDISHLYSIGLPDLCDINRLSEDAPSSKWFRDPHSGFLEFEPAYKHRSSSDNSPSSVESWLWCPSPSLWDDNDDSFTATQSRFETIYKPSVHSMTSDNQACQSWKNYEAIFSAVAQTSPLHNMPKTNFGSNFVASEKPYTIDNEAKKDDKQSNASDFAWRRDRLSSEDDGCVFDFTGWFSTSPIPTTTQSRKEIWLKNAETQNSRKHNVMLLQDCFDSVENGLSSNEAKKVWNTFDDIFCSFTGEGWSSFQHWFFDCDLSDEILYKMPQLFFSFPSSNWNVNEFKSIYTNSFDSKVDELFGDNYYLLDQLVDDDVFSSRICSTSEQSLFSAALFIDAEEDQPTYPAQKHDSTNSNTSLLEECITENQAWKSSLRIGNMWQSISGIRQVNVLYSEKQNGGLETSKLQPSSFTHFRPIHESDLDVSDVSVGSTLPEHFLADTEVVQPGREELVDFIFSTPKKPHASCDGCSDCDMKIRGLEQDLDNLLCDGSPNTPPKCKKNLEPRFRKTGQDKSMQTSFEEHIRQIQDDLLGSFSIRPPKANSR